MTWPAVPSSSFCPVARGVRLQWRSMSKGDELPELLALIAQHSRWLSAVLHARGIASGSPRARSLFREFEQELTTVTGCQAPTWLRSFDAKPLTIRDEALGLPRLDPGQQLLVCGGLAECDPATRGMIYVLLEASFGGHQAPSDLPDGSRT